ncbi:uncharacterized protein LOC111354737 [Spodoptera litura]|uniref:Uncharacterized protein LOC111354737 n=1 Tax=Spodoptera litura TaxID=69820 RepID=A0A9J7E8B5_SPOLT|nr:uncharacterized protein LOC111354737 [Spodoptera litura]
MFNPHRNAFLQIECPLNPRLINKVVKRHMCKKLTYLEGEDSIFGVVLRPAKRLESTQASLSAHFVDVTEARHGFGRLGLKNLIRDLSSASQLVIVQAVHTLLNQILIPEDALYLIENNVVIRLIQLLLDNDPIIREKVSILLTFVARYDTGRKKILSRPIVIDRIIELISYDRKEVRYAASLFLKTLTRDKCACEAIMKNERIVEILLKMIKDDYLEIVLHHMNSLKNLSEWDPVRPLKANAFQVMKQLLMFNHYDQIRVVRTAIDVMTQLCKHNVGKRLADKHDMTKLLFNYLLSPHIQVVVSTLGLLQYITTTTCSKWRAKQFAYDFIDRLITLAQSHTWPVLQLRALQVLTNLCECSDIRIAIKTYWDTVMTNKDIPIFPFEHFAGRTECSSYNLVCGYNYTTMCVEELNTVKQDYGPDAEVTDPYSYSGHIQHLKENLLKAMNEENEEV